MIWTFASSREHTPLCGLRQQVQQHAVPFQAHVGSQFHGIYQIFGVHLPRPAELV